MKLVMGIKNKRGMDKIISVYWFAILFIFAGAVVYMVIAFYGKPLDVREIEASLISARIGDCVSESGFLKPEVFDGSSFTLSNENFLSTCKLNFKGNEQEYYILAVFKDFNSKQELIRISNGNSNLVEFCKSVYDGSKKNPFCFQKSLYTLDKNNHQYQIDIVSVVNQAGKNE